MSPYVKSLQLMDQSRLLLTFENGEDRIFDITPYLDRGIFSSLKNPTLFATARIVAGSIEWENELDLSYDTLYLESRTTNHSIANQTRIDRTASQALDELVAQSEAMGLYD